MRILRRIYPYLKRLIKSCYNHIFLKGEAMQIDDELLNKLERLSMLKIDNNKREMIKAQLSEILGFVENIANVETSIDFEEERKTPLRVDKPQDGCVARDVLMNAPRAKDGFFIVPKIIE